MSARPVAAGETRPADAEPRCPDKRDDRPRRVPSDRRKLTPVLPLDDIRVLDLTVARAGPTCVRQLADFGADVIRVEAPMGAEGKNAVLGRHGSDAENLHRNKRSIVLDLKQPAAADVLGRLVDEADVLVENLRPGVQARLGFDYETVHARNPRLVYASISGFGHTGPYADRGGVDQIAQGMGGLMSVTGLPGTEPTRVGIAVSDVGSGLYLAFGVLAALHARERTGVGQWVRTSLLESMVGLMDFQVTRYTMDNEVPVQEGNHHPTIAPMGCFPTADGYVNVAPVGRHGLEVFCEILGIPDLPDDPRFETREGRAEHRAALNDPIAERLRTRTTAEWVDACATVGIPCGPVYSVDQMLEDPQVRHLGVVAPVTGARRGRMELVRNPVTTSEGLCTVRSASPEPGEHTDDVLRELGYSANEIAALHAQSVC
jgi:crotonobetainyl-CoA:carnitine CoA-transferase CaiB-like acyl-CoA transferase